MESRSEYSQNRESQSQVVRMVTDAKYLLYSIIKQMLTDDEQSIIISMLSLTIQLFQLLYIQFNRNLWQAWKSDGIAEIIQQITGYLLVTPELQYMSYSSMIILVYIFIGIIIIAVLLFLLLSNRNEKLTKTLPLNVLKLILNLILTILYMPFLDLFISLIICDQQNNHFIFQEIQCWSGSHAVHSVVALIFFILFYFLSILFSFLYFESRLVYTNPNSKLSGFDDFIFKTYIMAQVLNYAFSDTQYIQIIIIVLGNIVLYVFNYSCNSYNNLIIYKYRQIIIAISMWTSIMLAFSRILEDIIFKGTIYAWLLGIPLLSIIILQSPEERHDLLMIDPQKATSAQLQLLNHHLLRLHSWGGQLYTLIVEGYIKLHVQICTRPDCNKDLMKIIQRNYQDAIKRFPYDFQLKTRYGFFMLDFLHQSQSSLNEFNQASTLSPTLDCDFLIYRFKKVIEEEMNDQNYELIDSHNESLFASISKSFQNKIERVTLIQMDFWSQLQEDFPDLGRLNQIGLQIQNLMYEIDTLWKRILKFKLNTQKILRIYGRFMIDVVQDAEYGEQLIEKIKIFDTSFIRKGISLSNKDEISQESQPTIIISMQQDKFGQIINLNLACHIFGYMKNELINRKINVLVPSMFTKQHEILMKNGFDQKLGKERFVFVRNKQNYIMPCFIEMKQLQQNDGNILLIAQFKLPKAFKQSFYILYDCDDAIDSITQNCITTLGVELKFIQNKKLLITELLPALQEDREQFMCKEGSLIQYQYQEDMFSGAIQSNENIEEQKSKLVYEFQCYITQKVINNVIVGYLLRLELKEQDQIQLPLRKIKCSFQFKYNIIRKMFIAEFSNDASSGVLDASSLHDQSIDQSAITIQQQIQNSSLQEQPKIETDEIPKINYAEGIKTLQLFQNRIQEIDKDELIEESEDHQLQSVFANIIEQSKDNEKGISNIFRSRQSLNESLQNQGNISTIVKLKWYANSIFLLLITLSFLEYFYMNQKFSEIRENIHLINYENSMHSGLQEALTAIQNLKYLNYGIWQINDTNTYEKNQRKILLNQLLGMQDLNRIFLLTQLTFTENFDILKSQDTIQMQFDFNTIQFYDFMEATQQIISKGLEIANLDLNQIVEDQASVFFVEYNLLNGYWQALRNVSNELVISLDERTLNQQGFLVIILTIISVLLFVSILVYAICMLLIFKRITNFLQLFLDIPEKTVKYFYGKCENYISNLQIGEEEENMSMQDEMEKEEQAELNKTLKSRKKKKKFINSSQNQREYMFFYFCILAIILGYFIFSYFITENQLNVINQQIPEFNVTARCDAFYRFCDNAERQLFFNRSFQILSTDSYETIKQNIKSMYAFDTSMQQLHALNVDIQNAIYRTAYDEMVMKDPCPTFDILGVTNTATCQAFARGAIAQGMSIGVARYIENIRYIITIYDKFYGKGAANFTTIARGDAKAKKIVKNPEYNNILNLNNFNQTKESRIIQETYLKPSFQYLIDKMIEGFLDDISTYEMQKLAVFIVFNAMLFIIQFIIVQPFLFRLNKQITNTRLLITMIPIRLIVKINSIKQFVKETINIQEQY